MQRKGYFGYRRTIYVELLFTAIARPLFLSRFCAARNLLFKQKCFFFLHLNESPLAVFSDGAVCISVFKN